MTSKRWLPIGQRHLETLGDTGGKRTLIETSDKAAQLDQVRGVLYAMANVGEDFLAPVSSIAIHYALAARGRKTSISGLMDDLLRLRDVQDLPSGHWLPVATRAVSLGACALVVSGKPSSFLRSDYGVVPFGPGLGRLVPIAQADQLPKETVHRWLQTPIDTLQWADELVRSVRWADPFESDELQLFDHWSRRPQKRWVNHGVANVPDGPVVGRQIFITNQIDHYLLRYRRGRPDGLFQLATSDVSYRLRIALLARAGNALNWRLQKAAAGAARLTSYFLPVDETRLLEAIARVEASQHDVIAVFPGEAVDAVRDVLTRLGLKEERERSNGGQL